MLKFTIRIFLLQIKSRVDDEIENTGIAVKPNIIIQRYIVKIYARGDILPLFIVFSQSLAGSGKVIVKKN